MPIEGRSQENEIMAQAYLRLHGHAEGMPPHVEDLVCTRRQHLGRKPSSLGWHQAALPDNRGGCYHTLRWTLFRCSRCRVSGATKSNPGRQVAVAVRSGTVK